MGVHAFHWHLITRVIKVTWQETEVGFFEDPHVLLSANLSAAKFMWNYVTEVKCCAAIESTKLKAQRPTNKQQLKLWHRPDKASQRRNCCVLFVWKELFGLWARDITQPFPWRDCQQIIKNQLFLVVFPSICLTTSKPLNNCIHIYTNIPLNNCTALTVEVYNVATVNAVKK